MNNILRSLTGSIAPQLLLLFILNGCMSGSDAGSDEIMLLGSIPAYTDATLYDYINDVDEYTIRHFNPTQYTLYDQAGDEMDPLADNTNVPNVNLDLTLDMGITPKDLYFIFTNISPYDTTAYPSINDSEMNMQQSAMMDPAPAKPVPDQTDMSGQRGTPEATEFNRNPYASLGKYNPVTLLLSLVPPGEPLYDVANTSTGYFKIDRYTEVKATCRYSDTVTVSSPFGDDDNNKTLNIWVADNCWHVGGTRAKKVNQDMVNLMAEKFLAGGLDNDIYDWVTAIYGEEWETVPDTSPLSDADRNMLIAPNNEITVLLFDIDNDNSTTGGVLGYFWAKDNFIKESISYSNERIMFYMDAVLFATEEGASWNLSDRWPSEIISTLAHELQHMIQFYQKTVSRTDGSSGTETWIDEMCSLATEDLVSRKLGVNGPRGADFAYAECIPSASDPAYKDGYISLGRIPLANYFNEFSVTSWYPGNYKLISYALNYALGSYLSRNHEGAGFFRHMVQNGYTDYRAIEYALEQTTPALPAESRTFGEVLRKWAASNLVSDKYDTPDYYAYNNGPLGDWFTSTASTLEYTIGSIDLYRYRYQSYYGPYIYTNMRADTMPAASNIYYLAGEDLSGQNTWNIKLRSNVRLTVVARDALPLP
ncbi:MAG: hypothetical protein JXA07_00985 [Spirochaetes bacterium]|nr:hypothetical protein [Spirochaetota bacterium]